MNRLGRGSRSADEWASPHERARTRAAQRLDWDLDPEETAWLEAHLAECSRCQAHANEYLEIRDRLRALRHVAPEPPRDLWARTAAAIERESARSGRHRPAAAGRFPLGAVSGLLVVAVVIGTTLLANLPMNPTVTPTDVANRPTEPAERTLAPAGTPIVTGAGDVAWIRVAPDGTYGYNVARVDEVCPDSGEADCPIAQSARATALTFESDPSSIIGSPADNQAVVVARIDGLSKASSLYVMPLPTEEATTTSEPGSPVESPVLASAEPDESDQPIDTSGNDPDVSADPDETPDASSPTTDEPETAEPTIDPTTVPTESPTASAEAIAIAHDLIVAGDTAAYSPDGQWFAFTARPADESHGPDIYLWRVGDEAAAPVTEDHRSVFASWTGGRLVGSRPATTAAGEAEVESFLLNPATNDETPLADAGWRPIVAPSGDLSVTWNGTVVQDDDGQVSRPGTGLLELQRWDGRLGPIDPVDATLITPDGSAQFDARWDESGSAFAVWVQDPANPDLGRLSLYFVDRETGQLSQPKNAPRDVPALSGFSIGEGRLAWATPPGQGGEGSRVLIVAWTDDGVGRIESAPGDQVVVIR